VPEVPRVAPVGDRVQAKPVEGETVSVRATVPAKLWTDVTVILEVPEIPARSVTLVGLADTVKSWTVYVRIAE